MNIMFVGSLLEMNTLDQFPHASVAGNKMQVGILEGLYKLNHQIQALSLVPRRMFSDPSVDKIANKREFIKFNGKFLCENVPYLNLILLKQISIFISILCSLFIWALKKETDKKVIITYNTLSYTALPVLIISKLFKIKSAGIIADLPIQEKKGILRKLEDCLEIKLIARFDSIIPLTKYVATDFAPDIPCLVIEAGQEESTDHNVSCSPKKHTSKIEIMFSGSLNVLSGIELILSAFSELSDEYTLHIYGKGDREKVVHEYCQKHDNILYHGTVPNNEMMQIQRAADILVCPRYPDEFTTKYTFPSKILEYMTAGVPVVCNRLAGIPREYDDYINIVEQCTVEAWCSTLLEIGRDNSMEFIQRAERAKVFVKENKTWEKQCKKIYDFIGEV